MTHYSTEYSYEDTMNKIQPNTASDSLIKLKVVLTEVTRSLKERNDALESHLKQSGWTIRRMTPENHETKTERK